MQTFLAFAVGFIGAFIGVIAPGMLNMTALAMAIEKERKEGVLFSIGASIIVFFQALVAIIFSVFINKNPVIVENLTYAAIVIFLALAVMFYLKTKKKVSETHVDKKANSFLNGLTLSFLNMLAIPYYTFISTFGVESNFFEIDKITSFSFALGCALGVMAIYFIYVAFADYIKKRIGFIARNINLILAILFLVLGILAIIRIFK